jgi:Ca2+-binding RTX toxin-like protein
MPHNQPFGPPSAVLDSFWPKFGLRKGCPGNVIQELPLMAITGTFNSGTGQLVFAADDLDNTLTVGRNAAGNILANNGAVPISGGPPTVANTTSIQASGLGGNDTIALDESNGALPSSTMFGGDGNDMLTGGSGADQLSGEGDNDTILGKGGVDILHGGDGSDTLTGGSGDDQVFGDAGDDRMIWNPGDGTDLFEGGADFDTAEVNGGNGAETFTITANGTRVRLDRINPAPFSIDIGTTEKLVLNANGGDDSISASGNLAALISITVDGGAGNDTILGSNGIDTLLGGDGNDFIDGNQGNDVVFLGAGDDTSQWDPGDGSDSVEGQDGIDAMLFNGANINEKIDISANGERVRLFRDVGNVTLDLNDVETIQVNALGGADTITVNDLSGTDVTLVLVNLQSGGGGDAAADTVVVNGRASGDSITVLASSGSASVAGLQELVLVQAIEAANDAVVVQGLGGDDVINAASVPANTLKLTLDGGQGNDQISGSAGDDTILGGDGDDVVDGNQGNDVGFLGNGDDVFIWNPGDGNDIVEGQADSDTLLINGANAAEGINVAANGGRAFFRDIGAVTMDLNDVETIHFNALGGADRVVVNDLTGTDVTKVEIDLAGTLNGHSGDLQVDNVTVNGTAAADNVVVTGGAGFFAVQGITPQVTVNHAEAEFDVLTIAALDGDDSVDAQQVAAGQIKLRLLGGVGSDTLIGSAGDDFLEGGVGGDVIRGGNGSDTASYATSSAGVTINLATGSNSGGDATGDTLFDIENLLGSGLADSLTGNGSNNILEGGAGGDTLDGGGGNDTLSYASSAAAVSVNLATMTVSGGDAQGDVLLSSFRNVIGSGGADVLLGNDLANAFEGGAGADTLNGAGGNDTVIYASSFAGVSVNLLSGAVSGGHAQGDILSGFENVAGSALNDVLTGDNGMNALFGASGNDTLAGGLGNDLINGGLGIDSAVFAGNRSSYTFTALANGGVQVAGPDGTDTVTGVEQLVFNDMTVPWTAPKGDFNGDFQSDLLWRHADGTTFAWLMNNGQRNIDVDLSKVTNDWHIQDTGDFDGDGDSDIIWRNDDGTTIIWQMQNGKHLSIDNFGVIPNSFHIRGIGDLDGDGDSDILWQHDDGTTLAWLMQSGQRVQDVSYGQIPTSFHVQGMGDFDGDGDTDILWRHNDGSTLAWLMQNGQRIQDVSYGQIPTTFHVQATGDFDGDGDADILWRHNDGTTLSWLMQNGQRVQDVGYGTIPNTFHVQGTADINGSGSADVIWRHDDGTTLAWLMVNGQRNSDVSLGTIPTTWTIQEHHFEIV